MQVWPRRAGARPVILLPALAVLLLSACGQASPAAGGPLTGRSPRAALVAAERQLAALSVRYTARATLSLDLTGVHGLSPSLISRLARLGDHLTIDLSGLRSESGGTAASLSVPALGLSGVRIERIGTTAYLSLGALSGHAWYRTPAAGPAAAAERRALAAAPGLAAGAAALVPLRSLGPMTEDGLPTEHYQGAATAGAIEVFLRRALASALAIVPGGAGAGTDLAALLAAVSAPSLAVDTWIATATGRLDRATAVASATLDLSAIMPTATPTPPVPSSAPSPSPTVPSSAPSPSPSPTVGASVPSGTLGITVAVTTHWFDYGAPLTLAPPTGAQPLPPLSGAGGFPLSLPPGA